MCKTSWTLKYTEHNLGLVKVYLRSGNNGCPDNLVMLFQMQPLHFQASVTLPCVLVFIFRGPYLTRAWTHKVMWFILWSGFWQQALLYQWEIFMGCATCANVSCYKNTHLSKQNRWGFCDFRSPCLTANSHTNVHVLPTRTICECSLLVKIKIGD